MKKLIKASIFAMLVSILLPLLVLTAVGAVRGKSDEKETYGEEETIEINEDSDLENAAVPPKTIKLLTENGLQEVLLRDYLIGVLLGELPSGFEDAALEAQAIAARTFTLRQAESEKHNGAICTNASCCQAWYEPEKAVDSLENTYQEWLQRVKNAVDRTEGQVLTYHGALIDAVFYSCSGGRTESAADVWGTEVPYLQSVESPGEETAPRFIGKKSYSAASFRNLILEEFPQAMLSGPPEQWFGEIEYTKGRGVSSIMIGGQVIKGTKLRSVLGLNSTRFTLQIEGDDITFETTGFGHRVGMSQYGANAMALEGKNYSEILEHYYPGTVLSHDSSLR